MSAGADPSASGATRVAGSLNFKDKYAPDYPTVAIVHSAPGRISTPAQLDEFKLFAPKEAPIAPPSFRASRLRKAGVRQWPDYQRCVGGAPPNHDGTGPDISKADFTWCMTAIDWGWSPEETATQLMLESAKARENGARYAEATAQHAAEAVARRRGQVR